VGISLFGPDVLLRFIPGKPEESVTEVENGSFKILVRSQEFHHSGTLNIDICVAEISSRKFPTDKLQCFLNGYDSYKLSVKWKSQHEIEVAFADGTSRTSETTRLRWIQKALSPWSFISLCVMSDLTRNTRGKIR
jgi:hypothetical protein